MTTIGEDGVLAWLESLPWLPIGTGGLLATTVLMVLRGTLVPRSTLEDSRIEWTARLADKGRECDDWRQAFLNSEKARTQTDQQLGHLLELYRSTDLYIRSLPMRNGDPD